ncbi:MAG: SufD family Fe-S cluster assembly protein, partial [Pseudomonadota bacterium]
DEYQCVWLSLDESSQVTHSRNNLYAESGNDGQTSTVFRHLEVNVPANASYRLHNHSTGCATHRQNIHINCTGPGAHAAISSAALVPADTHLDQQITVEHSAAHSYSEQTIHNIAGDKANVTFNGRIHIHANSNGVQAHLTNKNLGMGDQATINTKPELEIYTDDVQCSHGATVGQLDADHLFYCASRGIDERSAKQLLSQAFLNVCTQGPLADEAADWFNQYAGEA